MAENYPLSLPNGKIRRIKMITRDTVGVSASPFTGKQQVYRHQGQSWEADITLVSMGRADAESWVSFLLRLRGQYGTFLLGDPNAVTPMGSASTAPGTPVINGANQTGDNLNITGLPANANGYLMAGDYIQLGEGATATLHKNLETINTNSSGQATLNIWPGVKIAGTNGAAVVVSNAKGNFRLASNESGWIEDIGNVYGVTFGAVQAQ